MDRIDSAAVEPTKEEASVLPCCIRWRTRITVQLGFAYSEAYLLYVQFGSVLVTLFSSVVTVLVTRLLLDEPVGSMW